jgi:hypothetical protein
VSFTITPVDILTETFEDWVIVTNAICNALATQVLTANTTAGVTSGNSILVGIFQSNVFVVNTGIRGGNISVAAAIVLDSNLDFGGQSLIGNTGGLINVGSDVSINSTTLKTPQLFLGTGTGSNANATHLVIRNITANSVSANVSVANNLTVNTGTFANLTSNNFTSNSVVGNTGTFANLTSNNFTANDITANTGTWSNLTVENLSVNNMVVESISQGPSVSVGDAIQLFAVSYDSLTTVMSTVDSWLKSTFRATEYYLTTRLSGVNAHQVAKLLVIHDGSDAYLTEFGTISTNTDFTLYQVTTNTTHVLLQANTSAAANARGLAVRISATT